MKKSFRLLSAVLSIVIFGIFIVARIVHGPFGAMTEMVSDGQFLLSALMFWTLSFSLFTEVQVFYDKKMTPLLRVMTTVCFIFLFIFINQIGVIIPKYSSACIILLVVAGGSRILAEIISIKKTD